MKVLIDGRSITQKTSGIGRYTDELIKGYVKYYGHNNVTVILKESIVDYPYKHIYCSYNRHTIKGSILFSFFLKKLDYDIYHTGDTIGPFWHKSRVKHIQTVHDLMFLTVPGFYGEKTWKIKLRILKNRLLFFFLLRDADQVISVSRTTRDDLFKYFNRESIVLREGLNKLESKSETKYMSLKPNSFFLYVGLGAPHKNIEFMKECFFRANTDKKLVICGKGHIQTDSDRVIYTGWVEDSELNYLYANCAAFIFPSLYEGFGLPVLEALSHHCKVFCSNAGSLGEFSEEVVKFFDPFKHEELIALLEEVDIIEIKVSKIEAYLSYFNWKEIWDEFHKAQK